MVVFILFNFYKLVFIYLKSPEVLGKTLIFSNVNMKLKAVKLLNQPLKFLLIVVQLFPENRGSAYIMLKQQQSPPTHLPLENYLG